jgi:hypothetical protein
MAFNPRPGSYTVASNPYINLDGLITVFYGSKYDRYPLNQGRGIGGGNSKGRGKGLCDYPSYDHLYGDGRGYAEGDGNEYGWGRFGGMIW